jgi:hypothetical protein
MLILDLSIKWLKSFVDSDPELKITAILVRHSPKAVVSNYHYLPMYSRFHIYFTFGWFTLNNYAVLNLRIRPFKLHSHSATCILQKKYFVLLCANTLADFNVSVVCSCMNVNAVPNCRIGSSDL